MTTFFLQNAPATLLEYRRQSHIYSAVFRSQPFDERRNLGQLRAAGFPVHTLLTMRELSQMPL